MQWSNRAMLRLLIENTSDREDNNMAEWQTVRLGTIVSTNQNTYSPKENWQFVNYLDTGNITMNRVDEIQCINILTDKLPSRARRKVKSNSIIYSTVRPNQLHYGIIKEQPENFLVSTGFAVIDVDFKKAVPDYIYYALTQQEVTEQLQAIAEQSVSAYPSIKPSDIEKLELLLPDKNTQGKIVAILKSIDEKIKQNNEINNNLELQAQALFKKLFSDTTSDKNVTLGNVTTNIRERIGDGNAVVLSAVNTGKLQPSDEFFTKRVYSKDISKYIIVREGTFAYNPARINIGSIGINDLGITGCVSPVYVVFSVDDEYQSFFEFYFKTETFRAEAMLRASGSVRQSLNYSDFVLIKTQYPDRKTAKMFNDFWLHQKSVILQLKRENSKLEELRDSLLPRLMSGEIDVSDIDL